MEKHTKKMRKRANAARQFMVNTCPASRHVHMMADALAKGQTYHMFTDEPEHAAGSLYSVITSLWEARDELIRLKGHWHDAEAPPPNEKPHRGRPCTTK